MAHGKQNTVRILQSTRKNNLPPAAHAAAGFVAGSAFIGIAGWMYLTFQAHESAAGQPKPQPEFQAHHLKHAAAVNQEAYAVATGTSLLPAPAAEAPEAEDGRNFDTDLTNAFKHPKADAPALKQPDPFAGAVRKATAQPTKQQIQQAATKVKSVPVAESKDAKALPAEKSEHAKPDAATASKPEIESPRGSVQMTVTQTPAPAKEAAASP